MSHPLPRIAHLVVTATTGRMPLGARFALTHGPLVLGRGAGADILVQSPYVARRHCRLERRGGSFWIVDDSSTGGTYVNEQRVDEHRLAHGDRILLGDVTLTFDLGDVDTAPDPS